MFRNLAFAILFCAMPLFAQNQPDWAKVHSSTMEAIDHLYNLRYSESEQKCNEVIKMAPGDPRGYFFRAMINYRRYEFSNSKSDYDKFVAASYRVEKACENLLKNNPKDAKAMFYQGGIVGYRGLAKFGNGDNLGAVWDGKKAYGLLEESMELDSSNRDVHMGFGLFNYLISQAPDYIRPALKLAGISGDRALGLKMLENAAANGIYTKAEARSWLAGFYRNEDNNARAYQHLNWLTGSFPYNGWYRVRLGNLLLFSMRRADDAMTQANKLIELMPQISDPDKNYMLGVAYLGLALGNYFKGDYASAKENFHKCISLNAHEQQVRDAAHYLALSLELSGNRRDAIAYYQKAGARPEAQERLKEALSAGEIAAEMIHNYFQGGYYDQAISAGEAVLQKDNPAPDVQAQLLYLLGRSYFEKGNFQRSEEQLLRSLAIKGAGHSWLPPHACYRLGLAQLKTGNKASARESFEKALSYEGYEQEKYLRRNVERELARLKKG